MKKFYTVYKTTNTCNGKIYIGCHETYDVNDGYLGSGKLLKRAIKKYGKEVFMREIIAIFDNAKEMYEMEMELVNERFIEDPSTYNIMLGGSGGFGYINRNGLNAFKDVNVARKGRATTNKILLEKYGSNYTKILANIANEASIKAHNERSEEERQQIIDKIQKTRSENPNPNKYKHTKEAKLKIGRANAVHQIGENNSQFGTCWIYNIELKKSKKIDKSDVNHWIELGWKRGRKMKFN